MIHFVQCYYCYCCYDCDCYYFDQDEETALLIASRYDHIEVVEILSAYGANVNERNNVSCCEIM